MTIEKDINQVAEYNPLIAAREELLKKYQGVVYDVTTPDQYDNAETERKAFVKLSNQIEKVRKEISAPLHAAYKAVIAKGNELAAPLDKRIAELAAMIKEQDAKQAAINAKLENQIADIRATPMMMIGKASDDMIEAQQALIDLKPSDFGGYDISAQNAINEALAQIEPMIAATVSNEALARKQAEQQAILDAKQAELDKAIQAQQDAANEAKRLADLEQARLDGIATAQRDAQLAIETAERNAQLAIERAERERVVAENEREQQERAALEAKQQTDALRPDQDKVLAWLELILSNAPTVEDVELSKRVESIKARFVAMQNELK